MSSGARLERAIEAVRDMIATASRLPAKRIGNDDDLIDDLHLDELELETVGLIIEEIFSIRVDPEKLFASPLCRTPVSLAEYCIRHSEQAAWLESRNGAQPRRAVGGGGCA